MQAEFLMPLLLGFKTGKGDIFFLAYNNAHKNENRK